MNTQYFNRIAPLVFMTLFFTTTLILTETYTSAQENIVLPSISFNTVGCKHVCGSLPCGVVGLFEESGNCRAYAFAETNVPTIENSLFIANGKKYNVSGYFYEGQGQCGMNTYEYFHITAITAYSPNSNSVSYQYDKLRRLTRIENSDGTIIEYRYDSTGNRINKTTNMLDSDNDGLSDNLENMTLTDTHDADTDDDGIPDGVEDANHNGIVDVGETDPCNIDTDGDGIQDGTELGYTVNDIGQDTDTSIFQPDPDPFITTDPTDPMNTVVSNTGGDINGNGYVELTDAIIILQILTSEKVDMININLKSDINNDREIGLEELMYIFQKLTDLRK